MTKVREWLTLILIGLLPFHALAVTALTKWIEGPGNPPMAMLAIWKEGVLAVLMGLAIVEIFLKRPQATSRRPQADLIDALIVALITLGIALSTTHYPLPATSFLLGFRYDFVPLVAFLILRRVQWSEQFFIHLQRVILLAGFIVAAYGIISFFLPASFFHALGYSDLHSLYVPGSPLAAFQQIGETGIRRVQSTMSGPNQLGVWLLVPLSLALVSMSGRKKPRASGLWPLASVCLVSCVLCLILTFSRAAWIGAIVLVAFTLWPFFNTLSMRIRLCLSACVLCLSTLLIALFPSVFLRITSSRGHIENPIQAIQTMVEHPLGLGLGAAGPATNRTGDSCVYLEEGSDASWAEDRPELCVFVGQAQVQPIDRDCACPFLPENWYLQIGIEMGWLGMILYVLLMGLVAVALKRATSFELRASSVRHESGLETFYLFIALLTTALFLHSFEDAAVAFTLWILVALVLRPIVYTKKLIPSLV